MGAIRGYKKNFTLIELLVVVGLMSLILGLGIPAFNRMARGDKVKECSGSIKLGLEQAQLRAASERRYVAMILPNGSVSDVLDPYRLGGFRLAYVDKNSDAEGNVSYTFRKWADTGWRNAPSGAIVAKMFTVDQNDADPKTGESISGCSSDISAAFKGADNLQSVTGVKDDAGEALTLGSNNALIFSPYGNTVGGSKLYLVISEAAVNGGSIVYPSTGKSGETANYLMLKLNNLTGRVEYYSNEKSDTGNGGGTGN